MIMLSIVNLLSTEIIKSKLNYNCLNNILLKKITLLLQMNTSIEKVIDNSLHGDNTLEETFIYDQDKLSTYILDLSLSENIRIKALEMYHDINKENTIELISRITGMYQFSGTNIIQKFLIYICINEIKISSFLKLECAKSLLSFFEYEEDISKDDDKEFREIKEDSNAEVRARNSTRKKTGYNALNSVCNHIQKDREFPTPCKVDAVCMLMETNDYKVETCLYFKDIINDLSLDCDFRYKTILSLEKRRGVSSIDCELLNVKYYITETCIDFLKNANNLIMYRILSGQYLLQNCEVDEEVKMCVYNTLYDFSTNSDIDYNLRADAADTLLNLGTDDFKIKAREIIMILGRIQGPVRNVYDNAQNVHTVEIEKSVGEIIEVLLTYKTMMIGENPIDFIYVSNRINDILKIEVDSIKIEPLCNNCKKEIIKDINVKDGFCSNICNDMFDRHEKIRISLNRIEMDRALYSKFNSNLSNVLVKLWSYIQENEYKEAMIQRLVEELEDMSGTCSTGFLSRLVNTLSGFGQLNIKISFDDQIISNFTGRLNMYARKLTESNSPFRNEKLNDVVELHIYTKCIHHKFPNAKSMKQLIGLYLKTDREQKINEILYDFEEQVLNEMMLETNKFNDRRHFLLFFREYMLRIREELYEEFKEFVTDTEFDLCIRKAISVYEGVQHMI